VTFRDDEGRVQRVGAYGVCLDDEQRILLCRLTAVTSRPGWWTLPGGGVDFGEHPRDALVREVREETGLDAKIVDLLDIDSIARVIRLEPEHEPVDYHAVRVVYRISVTGGELIHEVSGTTDRAEWFSREQLASLQLSEIADVGIAFAYGE
jgi:8-oxo-dGTP diphosphatase